LKERATTLLLAAGALLLFYVFFLSTPAREAPGDELPLSTENGRDGYQALWRWLRAQEMPVLALRQPYSWLIGRTPLTEAGNLLITTLPHRVPARSAELADLGRWVARGNTLLVLAALDDTPRWAVSADESFLTTLHRLTGLDFEASADSLSQPIPGRQRAVQSLERLVEPQRVEIHPTGRHPLFDGVSELVALSDFPASRWHVKPPVQAAAVDIGALAPPAQSGPVDEPLVWLERRGAGQLILVGVAGSFSNGQITQAGNARWLANVIAWSLANGGSVVFDDAHQGATAYYDAHAFFADSRLHRTLLWILLAWLVFVMGSQRLRPAVEGWSRPDVTTFIAVTGGFFASTLMPAAAGRRLFENFFDAVGGDRDLRGDGTAVWARLEADSRVPGLILAELEQLYARTLSGRRIDLVRVHNLLSQVKGALE
jgi:hypothetical protein